METYLTTNTTRNHQKQTFHCWDRLNAVKRDFHMPQVHANAQIHTRELERSLAEIRHTPKALLRASACVCFPQSACWKVCSLHEKKWNILKHLCSLQGHLIPVFNISKNTSHPFSSHVWGWLRGNFLCLNSLRGIAQASAASAKFPTHGGPKTAILAGVRLSSWCLSERIGFTMVGSHFDFITREVCICTKSIKTFEVCRNVFQVGKPTLRTMPTLQLGKKLGCRHGLQLLRRHATCEKRRNEEIGNTCNRESWFDDMLRFFCAFVELWIEKKQSESIRSVANSTFHLFRRWSLMMLWISVWHTTSLLGLLPSQSDRLIDFTKESTTDSCCIYMWNR